MSTLLIADEQDDVFTVRARLTSSPDGSYALVIPPENDALGRDVTMRLLARYVEALRVQLAVVSELPSVRRAAEAAGFDAFGSIEELEREENAAGRLSDDADYAPGALASILPWLLLALVLLSVAGTVYVLLPTAAVTLTPRTEMIAGAVEVPLELEPEARAPDAPAAYARLVEMQLEVEHRAPATGFGGQETRATGAVVLANRTEVPVTVPKGTIVSTARGVRFQTDYDVELAAGAGRVAAVPVTAVQPGESGNVASRQIAQVEGVLQPLVSVTNDEPTSGGSQPSALVTDGDREALVAAALDRARAEALSTLEGMVAERDVLVRDTVRVRMVDATFDRQPGDPAPEVNVRLVARASGMIVDSDELDRVAARVWRPTLRSGFENVPDSARVVAVEGATLTPQGAVVKARVESLVVARVDPARAAAIARWRTAREAETELMRAFELAKRPVISFDQPWAQRAYRVYVQVAPVR